MALHDELPPVDELPWTINYVIRKRAQIDSFNELPKDKRPPTDYIWYKPAEELDKWLDNMFDRDKTTDEVILEIDESEIE